MRHMEAAKRLRVMRVEMEKTFGHSLGHEALLEFAVLLSDICRVLGLSESERLIVLGPAGAAVEETCVGLSGV